MSGQGKKWMEEKTLIRSSRAFGVKLFDRKVCGMLIIFQRFQKPVTVLQHLRSADGELGSTRCVATWKPVIEGDHFARNALGRCANNESRNRTWKPFQPRLQGIPSLHNDAFAAAASAFWFIRLHLIPRPVATSRNLTRWIRRHLPIVSPDLANDIVKGVVDVDA